MANNQTATIMLISKGETMQEHIHVLVVEDNPGDAELIKEYFSYVNGEHYKVSWKDKLSSAISYLNSAEKVDLALVDLGLPDSIGINAIQKILEHKPSLPVVVLTGNDDRKTALEAIQAGAQDYLLKNEVSSEVLRRVCRYAREREQFTRKLRISEQFMRGTLDSLTAHIAILSENGDIIAVNHAWHIFASENNTTSPRAYSDYNYLDVCMRAEGDGAEVARLFAEGIRKVIAGEMAVFELDYDCHSPETKRWFHARVTPFSGGDKSGFVVVAHEDITKRKLAEIALLENQNKYRFLTENTVDCIWQMDLEANLLYVNQASYSLFGYHPEEMIGTNLRQYTEGSQFQRIQKRLQETIASYPTPQKDAFETEFISRDGTLIPVEISSKVITNDGGVPVAIQGVTRDISAKKKVAQEKKKLQELILQSQKMESLGTLAGGIAHDFNNILTAILGFTDLCIRGGDSSPTLKEDLSEIYNAGKRAKKLVSQILAFSRSAETEVQPLLLHLIITEACKLLRSTLPTSIEIRKNIAPNLGPVLADATKMHQVIMNLCTNASHAMQKDGGVLTISLREKELTTDHIGKTQKLGPGSYLELTVTDTGGGISADILPSIFDPYFTTKSLGEGTGLGLAVVHGIISNTGGDITVHSEPGKGTRFTILLPTSLPEHRETKTEVTESNISAGSGKVLVVDDEIAILRLISRVLSKNGYTVWTENNSVKALELVRENPYAFDLILSDITMPGMTGDKLSQRISHIRPDIPILLMTGYSNLLDEETVSNCGAQGLIMKPLASVSLLRKVREMLEVKP